MSTNRNPSSQPKKALGDTIFEDISDIPKHPEPVDEMINTWVCLKIGYILNYSHLIGIMIINQWVYGYTIFRHTHMMSFCLSMMESSSLILQDVSAPSDQTGQRHIGVIVQGFGYVVPVLETRRCQPAQKL